VVEICPGTYPEQIEITFPVTLEGISANNSTDAVISVPSGGLVVNDGNVAVQVWVQNATGEVNLSNLAVDGTGNGVGCCSALVIGVYYQNSPGTMNHLTVQNQSGNGFDVGVWLSGGTPAPSVTLENCNVQGFDHGGIFVGSTNSGSYGLNATIRGNYLSGVAGSAYGINNIGRGTTGSVSGNLITGAAVGIGATSVSISKNTVLGAKVGISFDGGSVASNTVFNSALAGISVDSSAGPVTGNNVVQSGTAIDLECVADNVQSNSILGAVNGLTHVPSGALTSERYYNVGTISSGGCQ
jgi:parallel beta-helix repeat protein